MTEENITIIINAIMIGIVIIAIAYAIYFTIWWNKWEQKKDEILMRYHENQQKRLLELLTNNKNKKDT